MSKESVMFSHWDGGRGHINRVLDVAQEAKRRSMRVGLITTKVIESSLPQLFDSVYTVPTRPETQGSRQYEMPLYSHARSHGQRQRGLGFSRDSILEINAAELVAIDDFKPNVIVNDYRDTIKNVADFRGVPLVGIVQSNGHTKGQRLGWFLHVDDPELPTCVDDFNAARESLGLPSIIDEREMFMGDYQIIPSIPEIDPVAGDHSTTRYVGLLSYRSEAALSEPALEIPDDYIVSNASAENRRDYGQRIILQQIPEIRKINLVCTGEAPCQTADVQLRFGALAIRSYVNYAKLLPRSKAFISYGGHGSTLSALLHGVPIIGMGPFSSEQRGTLENIQSYGAGVVLPHQAELESITAADMGGLRTYGNWSTSLTETELAEAIDVVTGQREYRDRAAELADKLRGSGGASMVVDILQEKMGI